ncbi:uncharacterized protein [Littorina saxatilis]|uniref:Uncharacterized protein n=1 Tax=Littorina saxatilis TaxID=31220 RepID=A0AAN9BEC8_9CAEN
MRIPADFRPLLGLLQNQTSVAMETNTTLSDMLNTTFSAQTSSPTPSPSPLPPTTTTTIMAPTQGSSSPTLYKILTSLTSTVGENLTLSSTSGIFDDVGGGGGRGRYFNTPLSAPEASLDPITEPPLLGDSADLDDLGWIIPATIACIAAMFAIALACYYGVRKLELRMLAWCYRNCSCCCVPGDGEGGRLLGGEQHDSLSEETGRKGKRESVRLRELRERSPSYGVTRSTSKEYVPKRDFNPFDD